jgi:hypothetical protein
MLLRDRKRSRSQKSRGLNEGQTDSKKSADLSRVFNDLAG